jgi:hypothetical protein
MYAPSQAKEKTWRREDVKAEDQKTLNGEGLKLSGHLGCYNVSERARRA